MWLGLDVTAKMFPNSTEVWDSAMVTGMSQREGGLGLHLSYSVWRAKT